MTILNRVRPHPSHVPTCDNAHSPLHLSLPYLDPNFHNPSSSLPYRDHTPFPQVSVAPGAEPLLAGATGESVNLPLSFSPSLLCTRPCPAPFPCLHAQSSKPPEWFIDSKLAVQLNLNCPKLLKSLQTSVCCANHRLVYYVHNHLVLYKQVDSTLFT